MRTMMQLPLTANILVIDDDPILRKSIKDYFEDSGFTVIEAENGQVGLEIFKNQKPDLIVTDLQMPVLGGLEVLSAVTKASPETPIVVISEAGGLNDVIKALRIGAWDYLTKPIVQIPVLEHAVCRALERSRLIEENRIYKRELELANQALKKSLDILEEDQEAGRSVQMK
ncbi:MAG TPA: response regulator, partial [Gammaproteobacteria bacterium]|nr:response regulator [Gammaproteobacteria bacterium]